MPARAMASANMKFLCAVVILAAAVECWREQVVMDQCLRRDLFLDCLKAVPKGPDRTRYNDWSEVVAECNKFAYENHKQGRAQAALTYSCG